MKFQLVFEREEMQRCIEKRELVSLALEPLGDSHEPDTFFGALWRI